MCPPVSPVTCRVLYQINPNQSDTTGPVDVDVNGRHLVSLLNEVVTGIVAASDSYPM